MYTTCTVQYNQKRNAECTDFASLKKCKTGNY